VKNAQQQEVNDEMNSTWRSMIYPSVATYVASLVILTRIANEADVDRRKKEKDFGNRLGFVPPRRTLEMRRGLSVMRTG
jgi:hypothetical protein